jgi:hypothetical protein
VRLCLHNNFCQEAFEITLTPLYPPSLFLVFFAVRVVTNESRRLVLPRTSSQRQTRLWGLLNLLYHWAPWILSPWLKKPGYETIHLPTSTDEVKSAWSYNSIPPSAFMRHVQLDTRRELIYFLLILEASSCFCDVVPCIPLKFHWRFGGTYSFHLQDRSNEPAKSNRDVVYVTPTILWKVLFVP